MADNYDLIREAISQRKQVLATYDHKPRKLCPHALGRNKDGAKMVLSWQFGGESSTSPFRPDWKCMRVNLLSDVRLADGDWHTGPASSHSRKQRCITRADVEIPHPFSSFPKF